LSRAILQLLKNCDGAVNLLIRIDY